MRIPPIQKSLRFWTLIVGLIAFVAQYYLPAFPLDEATILEAVVFILGLLGIVPELKSRNLM